MRCLKAAVIALSACAIGPGLGVAADGRAPIQWREPIEIATGGGQRGAWKQNESDYDYVDDPSVVLDARGAAAVVWVDQRRKDIFFQVYERDGTPRLDAPVNISRSPQVYSWLPRLVLSPVNPSDVFVLWQEIVFSGGSHGGEIFFARSVDGGESFGAPINLSRSIGGDGKGRINRKTWDNGSLDLAIAADGTLFAAWTEYDGALWFSRSRDRGESFTAPMLVSADPTRPARGPSLAADGETIYLAWTVGEDPSADVRIATSVDGGRTFGSPVIVAKTKGRSDAPKLAVDPSGTVHLVHAESSGGPFERSQVRYTRSRDRAQTFEPSREISRPDPDGSESAAFPALSVDARGDVYVIWELYPNARQLPRGLAIAISSDGGQTFTTPAIVPGSSDPAGGWNGSHQGRLMRKLAATGDGSIAVVNSSLEHGDHSRVWLMRGQLRPPDSP